MTRTKRIETIKRLLIEEPSDTFLLYALATEYIAENEDKKAMEILETLVNSNPEYEASYYHLGKLYQRMELKDKALIIYEEGIEVSKKLKNFKNVSEIQHAIDELLDY
jgi:tetratricopeptide (TPR) repeat protein